MTQPDMDLTNEIFAALRTIAPEIDPRTIDRGAVLVESLDIDSMDFLNFLEALTARVGVDIPEVDYPKVRSIDDIAVYLAAHRATGAEGDSRPRPS